MFKGRWILEAIVVAIVVGAFFFFRDAYNGYFNATAAVQQLNSSFDSLVPVTAYRYGYNIAKFLVFMVPTGIILFELGSIKPEKEITNEEDTCCETNAFDCTSCDCSKHNRVH